MKAVRAKWLRSCAYEVVVELGVAAFFWGASVHARAVNRTTDKDQSRPSLRRGALRSGAVLGGLCGRSQPCAERSLVVGIPALLAGSLLVAAPTIVKLVRTWHAAGW